MTREEIKGDTIKAALTEQAVIGVTFIEQGWISGYDTINLTMADGSIVALGAGGEDHGIIAERVGYR